MIGFDCRLLEVEMVFTRFRKTLCVLFPALLSLSIISCGGSNGSSIDETPSTHSVTGTITYKRLPIKVDDNGYPVGLESPDEAETLPLRGISVRAVYSTEETMPDDTKVPVWQISDWTNTNSEGKYTLYLPDDDTLTAYVEILSVFNYLGYNMRVIADPNGINSLEPQADRFLYSIRKGIDGSAPADNPTPAVAKSGEITLDIEIDLDDKWWVGHPTVRFAPDAELESNGTGSRIAAIIDTAFKAATSFGSPVPGYDLDFHYRQGITEPLGTYVEYDRERFPLSFEAAGADGGGFLRYFGSVRGGPENDDAWDEGLLLSVMARNGIMNFGSSNPTAAARFQFPAKKFPGFDPRNKLLMTNLQPTMAMAEGLPDAIAAITLKTPYLTSGSGKVVKDIRDITGMPLDIYSSPAITAFLWELALKANDIAPPGNPETWEEIEDMSINRIYSLLYESITSEETGYTENTDLPSIFTQLKTLSYAQDVYEPIDLAEIFTDEVITQMTTPFFGEIWPRPTEGPLSSFITDWGGDPDSTKAALPSFNFAMSDAVLDAEGNFSNLTFKENISVKLNLSKDTAYWLSVTTEPPLPNGASIELRINGNRLSSHIFNSSSSNPQRRVFIGNADYPISYILDFSLKSPIAFVPDTQINVRLDPVY